MRHLFSLIALAALALNTGAAPTPAAPAPATVFHVAPDGNDAWTGKPAAPNAAKTDGPFATLERARDAVRALKKAPGGSDAPVTILLRGGRYALAKPLVLTPEDSGAEGRPVTYAAFGDERPVLSGGVPVRGWRKHDDRLWAADVPWARDRKEPFAQLFVNGARRIRARTPDVGSYFYTKQLQLSGDQTPHALGISCAKGDLGPWAGEKGALIVLFHNWVNSVNHIKTLDVRARRIVFPRPAGAYFLGPQIRYYVENVRAGLDAPGEWYLDHAGGKLYYRPLPGEDPAQIDAIAPVVSGSLIVVQGSPEAGPKVGHLVFRGLSFQHTDADLSPTYPHSVQGAHTQRGALFAVGLHHATIERCEFARLGEHAVSLREGCAHNTVRQCHVHDVGGGGIYLSAAAPRKPSEAMLTAHNVVHNNFIHDGGHIFRAGCGVFLGGSASHNTITHNEICDLSWMGIHLGWSWTGLRPSHTHHNEVGWNHIHHLGNGVLNDIGGIYTIGVSPGTVLHHNRIHDITRFERGTEGYGGWGIYLDAGSSEIRVENNVAYDTRDGGFVLHCDGHPHDDVVVNNIFACSRDGQLMRNNNKEPEGNHVHLERNIVHNAGPKMYSGNNWKPEGKFTADRNCYWSESGAPDFYGKPFADWQATGRDRNAVVADPGFVDAQKRDFRLKPDSPALALGFKPLDLRAAGLTGDPAWTRLPQGIVHRKVETATAPAGPFTIDEDFEAYADGQAPDDARLHEEIKEAVVRISSEAAAAGTRSLKFTDGPGQKFAYNPHVTYEMAFPTGMLKGAFDLRLEPGASFNYAWRDWPKGEQLRAGPSLNVDADGTLKAGGRKLAKLPHGQWVRFEIACGTGPKADGRWHLTVRVPGQEPRRFPDLSCDAAFKRLNYIGFISLATEKTVFYIDNVTLKPAE